MRKECLIHGIYAWGSVTFDDRIAGTDAMLSVEAKEWFYDIVRKFQCLPEAEGCWIVNRDHETMDRKYRDAQGQFYTDWKDDPHVKTMITIDNEFINDMYLFNQGKLAFNMYFTTMQEVLAHEIAHKFKFRHCKTHQRIQEDILHKFYEIAL